MTAVVLDSGIDAGAPGTSAIRCASSGCWTRRRLRSTCPIGAWSPITGPDRLSWLHSLTTQHLTDLEPGVGVTRLVLSPQGHIEHVLYGVDDGETFWAHTEPGAAAAAGRLAGPDAVLDAGGGCRSHRRLRGGLDRRDVRRQRPGSAGLLARVGADSLGGQELFVPRDRLAGARRRVPRAGMWAYEARRIAAGVPRIGLDTDHRTIPNEIGLLGVAVHLDKGCYRGQETVARVHTLGRPPRRLVRLHLDGTADALPEPGTAASWTAARSASSAARPDTMSWARSLLVWSSATWTWTRPCWWAASPPVRRRWWIPRSACTSGRS